jgi:hypothetical protein
VSFSVGGEGGVFWGVCGEECLDEDNKYEVL